MGMGLTREILYTVHAHVAVCKSKFLRIAVLCWIPTIGSPSPNGTGAGYGCNIHESYCPAASFQVNIDSVENYNPFENSLKD